MAAMAGACSMPSGVSTTARNSVSGQSGPSAAGGDRDVPGGLRHRDQHEVRLDAVAGDRDQVAQALRPGQGVDAHRAARQLGGREGEELLGEAAGLLLPGGRDRVLQIDHGDVGPGPVALGVPLHRRRGCGQQGTAVPREPHGCLRSQRGLRVPVLSHRACSAPYGWTLNINSEQPTRTHHCSTPTALCMMNHRGTDRGRARHA